MITEVVKPHIVRDPYKFRFKVDSFWSVRKVYVPDTVGGLSTTVGAICK